ncbi:MAG: glycosyltransferase [Pseudonocardiales bacterium]
MAALRAHAHTTPLDTELELFIRILITSWPAYGHLYPMLPVARAAQHAGHELVLATGPDLAPHVEQRGFVAWSAGSSHRAGAGVRAAV